MDLPRVPDNHGDTVDEKMFSDLYIRTSWVDANTALDQIEKVSIHILPIKSNQNKKKAVQNFTSFIPNIVLLVQVS